MAITIYTGQIAKRKNSTLQPTLTDSYSCILKDPTSIDTPSFRIQDASFNKNYNYLKWDNNYYFITEITAYPNDIWEVVAELDPLATYKTEILASTQYVSYSSVSGGTWLADTRIPILKSTSVNSDSSLTGILSTIGCYILSVVGKNSCNTYMIQNSSTLEAILSEIQNWEDDGVLAALSKIQMPTSSYTAPSIQVLPSGASQADCFNALCQQFADVCVTLAGCTIDVQDKLSQCFASIGESAIDTGFVGNAYLNAPSCIRSCIWVPFDYALAPGTGGSGAIFLGTYDTHQTGTPISSTPVTGSNTVNIPWHYNDWRRSVCEDVYLYLPLVGMVQLSGDSLTHANTITINWSATYTDGVITYKVEAGGEVIGAYGGQCSANYPIGLAQQASAGEITQAILGGTEKVLSAAVNSSISPVSVGGVVAQSIATGALTGYEVQNLKNTTHVSSVGGIGGGAGIGLGRDCICYTVAHDTIVNPVDMKDTMGLPTMKPMSLSTLTGFCQCANAHVAAPAESKWLDAIDNYLNSGFYIE